MQSPPSLRECCVFSRRTGSIREIDFVLSCSHVEVQACGVTDIPHFCVVGSDHHSCSGYFAVCISPTMSSASDDESPRVAQARWGLLRAALKGIQPAESDQRASIHRFPGFQLLARNVVVNDDDAIQKLVSPMQESEDVESLLWALHCYHNGNDQGIRVELPCQGEFSKNFRAKLAAKGILCRRQTANKEICVSLPPNTDYICVDYRLPNKSIVIVRVRERLARQKVKLEALTSHQRHDGIDNTGNTRVWDSETTLAYLLMEESSTLLSVLNIPSFLDLSLNDKLRVLELGAGMAGLAGLFLAIENPESTQVMLSDGHPDAVQNNKVNIALNRPLHPGLHNITAERLVWTADNTAKNNDQQFDLILASDCTHFQEFHACLALTVANKLRVGGVAIMLQPPRGQSLENFVNCVHSCGELFEIHWKKDAYSKSLSNLHRIYSEDPLYDPNIHFPQLLILQKCRLVTDSDRQAALKHVEKRISR